MGTVNDLVAHGIPLANTDVNPVGTITAFAGSNPPSNLYMICDGRTLNVSDNPELFSVIGYTYGGSGDTFYIPDMRGRMPVGMSTSDVDFNEVGKSGDFKEVVLTENQISSHTHLQNAHSHTSPSHTHTNSAHTHSGTTANNNVGHTHTWSGTTNSAGNHRHLFDMKNAKSEAAGYGLASGAVGFANRCIVEGANSGTNYTGSHTHTVSGTTSGVSSNHTHTYTTGNQSTSHTHSGTTNNSSVLNSGNSTPTVNSVVVEMSSVAAENEVSGGGEPMDILNPFMTLNFIIKVR